MSYFTSSLLLIINSNVWLNVVLPSKKPETKKTKFVKKCTEKKKNFIQMEIIERNVGLYFTKTIIPLKIYFSVSLYNWSYSDLQEYLCSTYEYLCRIQSHIQMFSVLYKIHRTYFPKYRDDKTHYVWKHERFMY